MPIWARGSIHSPRSADDPLFDHEAAKGALRATAAVPTDELPYFSLRRYVPPIVDQEQTGSCTGCASRNFRETLQRAQGGAPLALSPTWLYREERALEGTLDKDAGAMPVDAMKTMATRGFVPWSMYVPDFTRLQTTEASAAALQLAQAFKLASYARVANSVQAVKAALANGSPVLTGIEVPANMETPEVAQTGFLPMPDKPTGGHAICIVEWMDQPNAPGGGWFGFVNSWGCFWGDDGFGYMPYAMLEDPNWVPDLWMGTAAAVQLNAPFFAYGSAIWNRLEPPENPKDALPSPVLPIVVELLNQALGLAGKNRLEVRNKWDGDIGNAVGKFQNDRLWSATQTNPNIVVGALDRYTLEALVAAVFPTDQDGSLV